MKQRSLMYLFDTDIVEEDVLDIVIIAAVDGHAALIVYLWLAVADDVDVLIHETYDAVTHGRISVDSYKNRMRHIGP